MVTLEEILTMNRGKFKADIVYIDTNGDKKLWPIWADTQEELDAKIEREKYLFIKNGLDYCDVKYAIPRAMFVGGRLNGFECDLSYVRDVLGNGQFSTDWSKERSEGRCVPRKELDNQPHVDGYLGPMWDCGKFRYETQEVYNMLSR